LRDSEGTEERGTRGGSGIADHWVERKSQA